jgi:hypothetical protein
MYRGNPVLLSTILQGVAAGISTEIENAGLQDVMIRFCYLDVGIGRKPVWSIFLGADEFMIKVRDPVIVDGQPEYDVPNIALHFDDATFFAACSTFRICDFIDQAILLLPGDPLDGACETLESSIKHALRCISYVPEPDNNLDQAEAEFGRQEPYAVERFTGMCTSCLQPELVYVLQNLANGDVDMFQTCRHIIDAAELKYYHYTVCKHLMKHHVCKRSMRDGYGDH